MLSVPLAILTERDRLFGATILGLVAGMLLLTAGMVWAGVGQARWVSECRERGGVAIDPLGEQPICARRSTLEVIEW